MAEENKEKYVIDFQTNADKASKDVDSLTGSVTQSEVATKKSKKATDDLKKSTNEASTASKSQKEALDSLSGGLGGAVNAVKALGKQFLLLLANPIIAGIAAIAAVTTLLFKAFTSTKAGGEALDRVFAGIGATIDVLRDRFLQLANGIASLNIKEIISSFSGLGDEIEREATQAGKLARTLQEVADATRDLSVSRSKLNRDLAASKELINDENASYADKKKAIDEVRKAEGAQTDLELANAKRKLQAILDQNELSDSAGEALQSSADAEKAVFDLQTQSANNRRSINKQDKAADSQESARIKGLADERKAAAKARAEAEKIAVAERAALVKKEREDAEALTIQNFKDEQDILTDLRARDAEAQAEREKEDERTAKRTLDALQSNADEKVRIEQASLEQEQTIQTLRTNIAETGLNLLRNVFGKSKLVQKAAMVAEGAIGIGKMIVANNTANIAALATPQAILTSGASAVPVIALNNVSTGIGVASTIAATAKALSSVGGGSGGSAGGAASVRGGSTAPAGINATPQTGFQASNVNQIATSINDNSATAPVVKAYVVGQDLTDQQKKDAALVSQNSFGGVITD